MGRRINVKNTQIKGSSSKIGSKHTSILKKNPKISAGIITKSEFEQVEIAKDGKLVDSAPVESIQGVGSIKGKTLRSKNIKTVKDFKESSKPKTPPTVNVFVTDTKFKDRSKLRNMNLKPYYDKTGFKGWKGQIKEEKVSELEDYGKVSIIDKEFTYEEQRESRMARAEIRAQRLEKKAERLKSESEESYEKGKALGDRMQGEPLKHGHHSEHKHRKDLKKAQDLAFKSVELSEEAQDLEEKAESIRHTAQARKGEAKSNQERTIEIVNKEFEVGDKITSYQMRYPYTGTIIKKNKKTLVVRLDNSTDDFMVDSYLVDVTKSRKLKEAPSTKDYDREIRTAENQVKHIEQHLLPKEELNSEKYNEIYGYYKSSMIQERKLKREEQEQFNKNFEYTIKERTEKDLDNAMIEYSKEYNTLLEVRKGRVEEIKKAEQEFNSRSNSYWSKSKLQEFLDSYRISYSDRYDFEEAKGKDEWIKVSKDYIIKDKKEFAKQLEKTEYYNPAFPERFKRVNQESSYAINKAIFTNMQRKVELNDYYAFLNQTQKEIEKAPNVEELEKIKVNYDTEYKDRYEKVMNTKELTISSLDIRDMRNREGDDVCRHIFPLVEKAYNYNDINREINTFLNNKKKVEVEQSFKERKLDLEKREKWLKDQENKDKVEKFKKSKDPLELDYIQSKKYIWLRLPNDRFLRLHKQRSTLASPDKKELLQDWIEAKNILDISENISTKEKYYYAFYMANIPYYDGYDSPYTIKEVFDREYGLMMGKEGSTGIASEKTPYHERRTADNTIEISMKELRNTKAIDETYGLYSKTYTVYKFKNPKTGVFNAYSKETVNPQLRYVPDNAKVYITDKNPMIFEFNGLSVLVAPIKGEKD